MSRRVLRSFSLFLVPVFAGCFGCDPAQCVQGLSNLVPEATASCTELPVDVELESSVEYAYAAFDQRGHLIVTVSTIDLGCGTSAAAWSPPLDCDLDGWAYSIDIPPSLAVPGLIDFSENPDVLVATAVMSDGNGLGTGWSEDDGAGTLEIVSVGEACVTVVFRGFGSGSLDPSLGGPELDGGVKIPRCDAPSSSKLE